MNRYLIFVLSLLGVLSLQAQELPRAKQQQLESFKVAFLTRRLSLTPAEAKVFWPVYDSYSNELESIRKDIRRKRRLAQIDFEDLSEKEMEALAEAYQDSQRKEYELRAEFHEALKEVLPIRKVLLYYNAENDLHRELLKRLREARQNRN